MASLLSDVSLSQRLRQKGASSFYSRERLRFPNRVFEGDMALAPRPSLDAVIHSGGDVVRSVIHEQMVQNMPPNQLDIEKWDIVRHRRLPAEASTLGETRTDYCYQLRRSDFELDVRTYFQEEVNDLQLSAWQYPATLLEASEALDVLMLDVGEIRGQLEGFRSTPLAQPELTEALSDLNQIREAAERQGYDKPPEDVIFQAGRLLREVYAKDARPYIVYPTPQGGIAIDAVTPHGVKVIMMCEPDGKGRGVVYQHKRLASKPYDTILHDDFIPEALRDNPVL